VVQYRDATSGFYALPRVHGDQVTIEIYQHNARLSGSDRFNIQEASSMLRGNLGQWMTLGSVGGETGDRRNQIGLHVQTRRTQDMQLELRVLPVD